MSNTDEKIVQALENLQTEVTALRAGQQALKLKVETYHTYQALKKRIARIKKHVGLPPLK
jgi:ribosomal protein L29